MRDLFGEGWLWCGFGKEILWVEVGFQGGLCLFMDKGVGRRVV